jgi:DNA-binding transcriptional ArsR family regulator
MFLQMGTELNSLTAKLFRGFADPSRLSIVEALRAGSLSVGEVVDQTGLSQSNVSNHLRCLADCGLVVSERDGRYVRYQLSDPRVAELISLAEELLADVARGVYACTRYTQPEAM